MKLELRATPEEVMRGVETLQEFAQSKGFSDRALFGLALALEECGSNIVNHALKRDASRVFHVQFDFVDGVMTLELRDSGPEFDPTLVPTPPPMKDDDDRPPGGWGIHLVRRHMDDMRYRREQGHNVLRLTKRLSSPEEKK